MEIEFDKKSERPIELFDDQPHVVLSTVSRRMVTAGILLGSFLAALETTVVGTAMPTIIASMGGLNVYSWVFSAYLLTSTVTVPVWGRLSDLLGRRNLYLAAIIIFLVGSGLSGAATNIWQLIIFRAVQGLGAGGIIPLGMTINGDIYTWKERARVQGLFSMVWGVASILGPLAGGFITDHFSWRWVFYINIPFGIAAMLFVVLALKEPAKTGKPAIDYAGASYLTIAITLLLIVLVETSDARAWTNPLMLVAAASVLLFSWLFVRAEQRAAEPIVPFAIFRNRIVAIGSLTSFLVGTAMFGCISFVPLFVQGTFGGSATESGSVLTPLLLGWVVLALIGGRLMIKVGYRPTVLAGLILVFVSFAILSRFGTWTPRWMLLADIGLLGSGMGLVMLALIIATQNSVGRSQLGIATSLNQFARSIGGAIGVAVMGTVMTIGLASQQEAIQAASGLPEAEVAAIVHNPSALIDPAARSALKPELLHSMEKALASALHDVFLVGAIFAGLAVVAGFFLPKSWDAPAANQTKDRENDEMKCPATVEASEKFLLAEMTTIDPDNEPSIH
nr:drug resistance MFS transporter, drug:H+ antiporter-2 (14 Spanner) (DHA2) family [uncultured bacterium]